MTLHRTQGMVSHGNFPAPQLCLSQVLVHGSRVQHVWGEGIGGGERVCSCVSPLPAVGTGSCTRKSPLRPPAQNRPPLGLPGPVLQQAPVHRLNPTTSTHRRRTYSLSPSTPSHTSPVQGRRRKRVSGGEGKGRGAAPQPEVHVKVPTSQLQEVGSETQQAKIAAAIEKQK